MYIGRYLFTSGTIAGTLFFIFYKFTWASLNRRGVNIQNGMDAKNEVGFDGADDTRGFL